MTIQSVGVLGCGVMGLGIARAAAGARLPTTIVKVTPDNLDKAQAKFMRELGRDIEKDRLSQEAGNTICTYLKWSDKIDDIKDCDLAIESIVEDLSKKQDLFRKLDEVAKPDAIFASNTSALSIMELAYHTTRYKRFVGMHFFIPPSVMKLVELAQTPRVEAEVMEEVKSFVYLLGKTPVVVLDSPGNVVNRLKVPYLLDAMRVWESGIVSMEDLDLSMKLGCGEPMGPFELCDYIGLDTVLAMSMNLYGKLKEARFAPPPLLGLLVSKNQLGRKTKNGFYDYTADPKRPNFTEHPVILPCFRSGAV